MPLTSLSLGEQVDDVVADPMSSRLFVATAYHVKVVDTATQSVGASIPITGPQHRIAFDPVSGHAFVSDHEHDLVAVVDPSNSTVVTTIQVFGYPFDMAVHPGPSGTTVAQALPAADGRTLALLALVLGLAAAGVLKRSAGPAARR
ncbi:MAG: hypothetical protein WBW61_06555 [Rhodanobacteraceae bacterium]